MEKFNRYAPAICWVNIVKKIKEIAAAVNHTHAASDITSEQLPVEFGGTGGNTDAAARAGLGIATKTFFNGTWSSGNQTMSADAANYSLFAVFTSSTVTPILAFRNETAGNIRGSCVFENGSKQTVVCITITTSGNSWTLTDYSYMHHNADGSHSAMGSVSVTKIIGIL